MSSTSLFSSRCLLALQAVSYMALRVDDEAPICAATIEQHYGLNRRALESVMQALAKAGIVEGQPGARGGYRVARPDRTTLADVVACFSDAPTLEACVCDDLAPLLLPSLQDGYEALLESLRYTTLADIRALAGSAKTVDYMI